MMRSTGRGVLLMVLAAGALHAQRGRGRPQQQQQRPAADSQAPDRAALEQQVRRRLGQQMKRNLGLTEAQMQRIQETNRKYEDKRRLLNEQERDVRMSLRDEMIAGDSSRQNQVAGLLDRMLKVQHQRLDLLEQEQKDLAGFLTPLQRAKYFGMEERVRQQMQNMRQQQMGPGGQPGPGGPPGAQQQGPPPRCDQLDEQQRQKLIQRRNRGLPIPEKVAPCLPPKPGGPPPEP